MTNPDTSPEAVERIAAWFEAVPNAEQDLSEVAALLRQLAKEKAEVEARAAALEKALKPFAAAWKVVTDNRPEIVRRLSLAELEAIAKHHVSAPAFLAAALALITPKPDEPTGDAN